MSNYEEFQRIRQRSKDLEEWQTTWIMYFKEQLSRCLQQLDTIRTELSNYRNTCILEHCKYRICGHKTDEKRHDTTDKPFSFEKWRQTNSVYYIPDRKPKLQKK